LKGAAGTPTRGKNFEVAGPVGPVKREDTILKKNQVGKKKGALDRHR